MIAGVFEELKEGKIYQEACYLGVRE